MKVLMPIRAAPYRHQREAFAFACRLFGLPVKDDYPENPTANTQQKTHVNIPSPERLEPSE